MEPAVSLYVCQNVCQLPIRHYLGKRGKRGQRRARLPSLPGSGGGGRLGKRPVGGCRVRSQETRTATLAEHEQGEGTRS